MTHCISFRFAAKRLRFGMYTLIAALGVPAGFGLAFGGTGCGGALGGECLVDSDCDENLVCADQYCHSLCKISADCKYPDEKCLIGGEENGTQFGYCRILSACDQNTGCGDGRICTDRKCYDACTTNDECLTSQTCFQSACRDDADVTTRQQAAFPSTVATGGEFGGGQSAIDANIHHGNAGTPEPVPVTSPTATSVSWSADRPIRLRHGDVRPAAAASTDLSVVVEQAKTRKQSAIHVIAQRSDIPSPEAWNVWKAGGIEYAAYLGEGAWVLRVDLTGPETGAQKLDQVGRDFHVQSLSLLRPEHKAHPKLLAGTISRRALDPLTNEVEILVTAFADTPRATVATLLTFHSATAISELAKGSWTAKVPIAALQKLIASDDIQFVEEGPFIGDPLMSVARANTGVDTVQKIDTCYTPPTFRGFTGKNVRVSNSEGLDANHDDFWNHNSSGARTTPRWLACTAGNGAHGTMTAGIMMGNGWNSLSQGGTTKYQYRGMAPEAIYDCSYNNPDVANWSFVQSYGEYNSASAATDTKVGAGYVNVGAVGNQGIQVQYGVEAGYYSAYRVSKNEIIVGNFNDVDFGWNQSSLGPTWDGRLKPDIAAPGSSAWFPRNQSTPIPLEIDWIQVTGTNQQTWNFNTSGSTWQGGWGVDTWWGNQNLDPITQITEGAIVALRAPIKPGPYGSAWQNRPLLGTLTFPDGITPLNINGASGDTIKIRYRLPNIPNGNGAGISLMWSNNYSSYTFSATAFRVVANGQWNTATIDVGSDPQWVGLAGINELLLRVHGAAMWTPAYGTAGYGGAGGSSAASPVVAGAVALLHDQIVTRFGAVLGNHSANSPFFFGAASSGMPFPSTFKAILTHTARDLAYIPRAVEPNNPDTGSVTVYHRGPDLASGYGMLDVEEASRLVDGHIVSPRIIERKFTSSGAHTYTIDVPAGSRIPLKVTLAWDDAAGSPIASQIVSKLVNNLDLTLTSPSGTTHYPYSFDPPYVPTANQHPGAIEPEPLTAASIRPARRNQPNTLDNVEQVVVEFPQAGTWQVTVTPTGLAAPPQTYSLVLGTPPKTATNLNEGKVVFCSSRTSPPQLFVQAVGANTAPTQVTFGSFPARHPAWSRNGLYIAYVTQEIVGPSTVEVLKVIDSSGNLKATYPATTSFGVTSVGYPEWSPDGKKIIVTAYDTWGARGLKVLQLPGPYSWSNSTSSQFILPGVSPSALDATDAMYSSDGSTVYFHADNDAFTGALYQIPSGGGTPIRLYGDAEPTRRGYHASIASSGKRLIFNSEMWKEGSSNFMGEEIVELDLMTGTYSQLTKEPGNQYGWFAINGKGDEFVMQSNTSTTGNTDIFLQQNGIRAPLYIADPSNLYSDYHPQWWKPVPTVEVTHCPMSPVPM